MSENDQEVENILDNLDFKPITEGLGFHHSLKEKKQIKTDLNHQSELLKNEFETRAKSLKRESSIPTSKNTSINRGDLTPFYENTQQEVEHPIESLSLEAVTSTETQVEEDAVVELIPGMGIRFFAWAIDVAILIITMVITFAAIIYFAELPLETLSVIMITDEIFTSLAFVGVSYYVFYFSVLDKTGYSTIGKNILGLKVVGMNNKSMSLYKSLFRTFLNVFSIALLGLPAILDIPNKMTDSKVVHR